ncbi:Endoribonuclease YbeY [Candidatus Hepatincola sp. Pdp]
MATIALNIQGVKTGLKKDELYKLKTLAKQQLSVILENLQNQENSWLLKYSNELLVVELILVNSEKMQKLNYLYRQKNTSTNVLSLQNYSQQELRQGLKLPKILIGSVIICIDVAKNEAKQSNTPFDEYFLKLLIHGLLHLMGYDHSTADEAKEMYALENYLLQKLNLGTYGIIANYWK